MVLFSSAPEELADPKSHFSNGGRMIRVLELAGSGAMRNSPSLTVHSEDAGRNGLLALSDSGMGVSTGCCVGMLGDSKSGVPFMDRKWKDGEVEVGAIGLLAGQPARTRQVRKSPNAGKGTVRIRTEDGILYRVTRSNKRQAYGKKRCVGCSSCEGLVAVERKNRTLLKPKRVRHPNAVWRATSRRRRVRYTPN